MVIAVDIRFADEDYRHFIYKTFGSITKDHPQHSFLFILDEAHEHAFIFTGNVTAVVIKQANIPLVSRVLTDKKVAAVLKKYKADVFINATVISSTKVPQLLIYDKNVSVKGLGKAKAIVTPSAFTKIAIIGNYKIGGDKIDVVYPGCDEEFHPIEFVEREKLKYHYAEGKEYFLCRDGNVSAESLLNVLKAFSIFKKRQKSSMQLVFASTSEFSPVFLEQLNLYKFKSEVKILAGISKKELAEITGGAYAAIYFDNNNTYYFPPVEGMRCNVPVITTTAGALPEICGDAALYAKADDNKDVAEKMMLIFKDERLRSALIEKGKEKVDKLIWDIAAQQLWESVEKADK